MGTVWVPFTVEREHVQLRHADLVATVYAPDSRQLAGYVDVDKGTAGSYRSVLSLPLPDAAQWLTGQGRRSVHRPAVEALLTEWPHTALALLVHHTQGRCSTWCAVYTCPLAGLDSTAAQAGHTA